MKLQTGIKELDGTLNGGFTKGSLSLLLAEGDFSGKTTTLTYLANRAAEAGARVTFASFDQSVSSIKDMLSNPEITPVSFEANTIESMKNGLSPLCRNSDVIFIDNLNRLEYFGYSPEAVSVVHNLRAFAQLLNIAIVTTIGVFPEHDVVSLLRISDVALDIAEFHHKTFRLGVLKNTQGSAGCSISFGVSH